MTRMHKIGIPEVRAVLIALLHEQLDEPPPLVKFRESDDRQFLLITCCARIIEDEIQKAAVAYGKNAVEGLETLFESMRERLQERRHEGEFFR